MISEKDSEQFFRSTLNEKLEAAILCKAKDNNPNYLSIIQANEKFYENFAISENDLIGKSYDFLFSDFDLDYSSEDNIEYVRLIKAVKDSHQCSVIVNIYDHKSVSSKSRFKISFVPSNSDQASERSYSIFTFEKVQVSEKFDINRESHSHETLLRNLQRKLRAEEVLSEVANFIISDLSIIEVAQNIAKILAEHLKANRCVIHDYKNDLINFKVEYCDPHSRAILKEEGLFGKYSDFQNQFYTRFGNKLKKTSITVVEDLATDQNFLPIEPIWREFSIRSQIAVTTSFGGKINGGIYIHQSSPRVWLEDEVELVDIISDQFSIALDRADSIERVMITNQALVEKTSQLHEALKHEQEMRKMQNEFVALVSHEFKTPLQIIDSTRELVERKVRNLNISDESLSKSLDRIRSGVYRMNGLINSVLNLAKIESGESSIKLERSPFNFKNLVNEIIDKNSALATSKNIRIVTKIDDSDEDFNGDAKLLDHAFTNIIANAIKYSKNDSVVKILAKVGDKKFALRVVDQGIGIPKDDLSSIGKKFFRAGNTTTVAGTGIGIYLTKHFIEMHEGEIVIDSEVNVGTSVTVILPRV
ncbi:MAG: GAF domain-containing sensor histidine kinase [Proteobacteria bacterium]|nr:GAF domain-containing sensor histidine kinase [Pseudomonadota bacterium]